MNIRSISRFINFFPSVSIYTHFVYPDTIRCTLRKSVMLCSGYAQIFFPATFILYLCPKKISTNHFEFYASSKQCYAPTPYLAMSSLLPVTPIIQVVKTWICNISATTGPFSLIFSRDEALPLRFLNYRYRLYQHSYISFEINLLTFFRALPLLYPSLEKPEPDVGQW